MYCRCPQLTGNGPFVTSLLICRPIGDVTTLLLLFAYQFTKMLGDVPIDHPAAGKYEKKH